MTHDKRGIAVIFNQVNFSIKCSTREGSDKDRDDLQQLLNELNFEVKTYNDLNVSEITDVLKMGWYISKIRLYNKIVFCSFEDGP